jgi:hypothetical protein
VHQVIGDARKFPNEKAAFEAGLSAGMPSEIAESTFRIFAKSATAIDNLSAAIDFAPFFAGKAKKTFEPSEARKAASDFWANEKQRAGQKTSRAIDRMAVESAARAISRKRRDR